MHIALRKWNGDIVFSEQIVYRKPNGTFNFWVYKTIAYKKVDAKHQSRISKIFEEYERFWTFKNAALFGNTLQK